MVKGTHRSEFGYDGFGHRVDIRELDADANGNWATSVDTKYVWEGAAILESRNAEGSATLQRYYAQGFMDSDGTAQYYTRDHLGSTRELVDALGAIRARYDYNPYGRMTKIAGDKESPFLYTGHLWHPYSGLYLTLYREYDANLGRWVSRDPLNEVAELNLYVYVHNKPLMYRDPLGLFDWDWSKIACQVGVVSDDILSPALALTVDVATIINPELELVAIGYQVAADAASLAYHVYNEESGSSEFLYDTLNLTSDKYTYVANHFAKELIPSVGFVSAPLHAAELVKGIANVSDDLKKCDKCNKR